MSIDRSNIYTAFFVFIVGIFIGMGISKILDIPSVTTPVTNSQETTSGATIVLNKKLPEFTLNVIIQKGK